MASSGRMVRSVEELKASTKGAIAIGPFGSRMKSDCYVPSGVPVIRGTNIGDTRQLIGEMVCITPSRGQPSPIAHSHRVTRHAAAETAAWRDEY